MKVSFGMFLQKGLVEDTEKVYTKLKRENAKLRRKLKKSGLSADAIRNSMFGLMKTEKDMRQGLAEVKKEYDLLAPNPLSILGELLVLLRKAKKIKQVSLAKKLKVDPSMVSHDEGRCYKGAAFEKLARIAELLGYRVEIRLVPIKKGK